MVVRMNTVPSVTQVLIKELKESSLQFGEQKQQYPDKLDPDLEVQLICRLRKEGNFQMPLDN